MPLSNSPFFPYTRAVASYASSLMATPFRGMVHSYKNARLFFGYAPERLVGLTARAVRNVGTVFSTNPQGKWFDFKYPERIESQYQAALRAEHNRYHHYLEFSDYSIDARHLARVWRHKVEVEGDLLLQKVNDKGITPPAEFRSLLKTITSTLTTQVHFLHSQSSYKQNPKQILDGLLKTVDDRLPRGPDETDKNNNILNDLLKDFTRNAMQTRAYLLQASIEHRQTTTRLRNGSTVQRPVFQVLLEAYNKNGTQGFIDQLGRSGDIKSRNADMERGLEELTKLNSVEQEVEKPDLEQKEQKQPFIYHNKERAGWPRGADQNPQQPQQQQQQGQQKPFVYYNAARAGWPRGADQNPQQPQQQQPQQQQQPGQPQPFVYRNLARNAEADKTTAR